MLYCLDQSVPTDPARQSNTLDHPRIAPRLYKHSEAIIHNKQML